MLSPGAAACGAVLSGGLLAASCVIVALTAGGSGVWVVVLLLTAGIVHVGGELLFVATS